MTVLTPVDYERAKEAHRRGTLKIRSVAYALDHAHQSGWSMPPIFWKRPFIRKMLETPANFYNAFSQGGVDVYDVD